MQLPKPDPPTSVFIPTYKILSNLDEKWHFRKKSPYQEGGSWGRHVDMLRRSCSSCPAGRSMVIWPYWYLAVFKGVAPVTKPVTECRLGNTVQAWQECSQGQTLLGWLSANEWASRGARGWSFLPHLDPSTGHFFPLGLPQGGWQREQIFNILWQLPLPNWRTTLEAGSKSTDLRESKKILRFGQVAELVTENQIRKECQARPK